MLSANEIGDQITMCYPFWRTISFPFYTLGQLIFVLVVVGSITIFSWIIDAPGSLTQYAVAAYIGAVLMSYFASPSHMERPTSDHARIDDFLRKQGLVLDVKQDIWLPEFPRFLLYAHTNVKITRADNVIQIVGPYRFLVELRDYLRLQ